MPIKDSGFSIVEARPLEVTNQLVFEVGSPKLLFDEDIPTSALKVVSVVGTYDLDKVLSLLDGVV